MPSGKNTKLRLAKEAAKERNVKVRILVPENSLIEQKVQQLKEYCPDHVIDVRCIEQMTETNTFPTNTLALYCKYYMH